MGGFSQTRKKGHVTTMATMSTTLKDMATDLAPTLTPIKFFKPFLAVPEADRECTGPPFTLEDLGAAAAKCPAAVNFSNLDRFESLVRILLTTMLILLSTRIEIECLYVPSHDSIQYALNTPRI